MDTPTPLLPWPPSIPQIPLITQKPNTLTSILPIIPTLLVTSAISIMALIILHTFSSDTSNSIPSNLTYQNPFELIETQAQAETPSTNPFANLR